MWLVLALILSSEAQFYGQEQHPRLLLIPQSPYYAGSFGGGLNGYGNYGQMPAMPMTSMPFSGYGRGMGYYRGSYPDYSLSQQMGSYGYPQGQFMPGMPFTPNFAVVRDFHGGNEFRDEEGSFEDPNKHGSLPVSLMEHTKYIGLIGDKENFQASGCHWDLLQQKCVDTIGLCKGGCRDFAVSATTTLHDCRCIPYGYAALLKLAGK